MHSTDCTIPTIEHPPIAVRQYRYSQKEQQAIQAEVDKLLTLDVIEPSKSPWSAPVVLVKKKDGSLRFCIDYRKLNAITQVDAFPLPNIQDTLDAAGGSSFFTTLDLKSGYWQLPVAENDKAKTAFSTCTGHYQWKRAPFGLRNMPSVFQRLMTTVLRGLNMALLSGLYRRPSYILQGLCYSYPTFTNCSSAPAGSKSYITSQEMSLPDAGV